MVGGYNEAKVRFAVIATNQHVRNWLHLRSCDQVGSVSFFRLLEAFGTADQALAASAGKLAAVKGIGAKKSRIHRP